MTNNINETRNLINICFNNKVKIEQLRVPVGRLHVEVTVYYRLTLS